MTRDLGLCHWFVQLLAPKFNQETAREKSSSVFMYDGEGRVALVWTYMRNKRGPKLSSCGIDVGLPGGYKEPGENAQEGAVREFLEEFVECGRVLSPRFLGGLSYSNTRIEFIEADLSNVVPRQKTSPDKEVAFAKLVPASQFLRAVCSGMLWVDGYRYYLRHCTKTGFQEILRDRGMRILASKLNFRFYYFWTYGILRARSKYASEAVWQKNVDRTCKVLVRGF